MPLPKSRLPARAAERPVVAPAWVILALAALVGGALWLLYPRQDLEQRLVSSGDTELSNNYLDNLLHSDPDNPTLRLLLARRQIARGDTANARLTLQPALASTDPELRRQALWTQGEMLYQEYERAQGTPQRADRAEELNQALERQVRLLAQDSWSPEQTLILAAMADRLGIRGLGLELRRRAVPKDDPAQAEAFYARQAKEALDERDYEGSAQLYVLARRSASDPAAAKRHYFAAIAALRAGDKTRSALDLAERELGPLAHDKQALYSLVELARAAGRLDVADRYVRQLLGLGQAGSAAPSARSERKPAPHAAAWRVRHGQPKDRGEFDDGAWLTQRPAAPFLRRVDYDATAAPDAAPVPLPPFDDKTYTLAYEVFLENDKPEDAWTIADTAVRQLPDDATWRERLAQVSEWTRQPAVALQNWLVVARRTDKETAWEHVLRLAPEQFKDPAAAQALDDALRAGATGSPWLGLLSVQRQVMQGEVAKANAALQPLLDSPDPALRKQALWTQAEVSRYRYRHAAGSTPAQRAALRKTLQQQVHELAQQTWPAERQTQLAAMANQAGDSDLAMRLYGQSAPADPARLAAFYEREAGLALAQGDYQGSAQLDLLARQNTADPAEAKRYYFAAIAALRSGNEPKAALELAERELGPLADDRQTLYMLTELARAAGRPDVAAKYVRQLLKVGLERHLEAERLARRQAVMEPVVWREETTPVETIEDGAFDDGASLLARPGQGPLRDVADRAPAADPAGSPFDDKTYTLAYQVFLESRQLEDAWAIADAAVRQRPGDLAWRKRLAQVSEWTNRPVMALDNWLAIAKSTNQEEAWQNVLRIAPGQFDDQATLLALRHELARRPDDPKLVREFVAAQERVGQPQPAIDYLRQNAHSPANLQLLAELAERAGQGKLALATWRKLFSDPAQITPDRAMRAALLAVSQGQAELGLKWLVAAQDETSSSALAASGVPPAKSPAAKRGGDNGLATRNRPAESPAVATELARLTGQVARNQGDNRLAIAAYRRLAASRSAKADDYDALFQLLKQEHPVEAAHAALLSWQRYGEPRSYFDALTLLSARGEWAEFGHALALQDGATGAARQSVPQIHKAPQFLRLMGAYDYQAGRLAQARAYYEQAYAADPRSSDTRQELLWLLIDSGDTDALRKILALHEPEWSRNSDLHDALAGAYLALSQPGVALQRYLTPHLAAHGNDFLWMMNYADALEQNDESGRAWTLRRELLARQWQQMRGGQPSKTLSPAQEQQQWLGGKDMDAARRIARARLLIAQRPGDPATAVLRELLRLDRGADGQYSNAAAEVAISWLQEAGQFNAERGFLWQQYARSRAQSAKRPLWAEISVAQGQGDNAATGQLLERHGQSLSAADRASAATAVGDTRLAQSTAFDGLTGQPHDDGMQQQLTESLLDFSKNATVNAAHRDLGGVSENQTGVGLHLPWNPRWSLDLGLDRINRNVTAHDLYLSAPAETVASATLDWRHINGETKLKASNRRGYTTTTPILLQHEQRLGGRFTVRGEIGWHLPADDTLPLRLGGMKTRLAGSLAYQFTRRDQLVLTQAGERYRLQTGVEVGNGSHTTIEYTHAFRTDAPAWQAGAFWSNHRYHSRDPYFFGAQGGRFQQTFVPPGQTLDIGYLLPTTFQFYGVTLSTNTGYEQSHTRAIRPFASVSFTRHSQLGAGYDLALGVAGSVLGGDHLSLGWEISKSGIQSLGFTRTLQLSYQLNF